MDLFLWLIFTQRPINDGKIVTTCVFVPMAYIYSEYGLYLLRDK